MDNDLLGRHRVIIQGKRIYSERIDPREMIAVFSLPQAITLVCNHPITQALSLLRRGITIRGEVMARKTPINTTSTTEQTALDRRRFLEGMALSARACS